MEQAIQLVKFGQMNVLCEALKHISRDTSESSNQIYRDIGLTNGCGMGALATPACNLQLEL